MTQRLVLQKQYLGIMSPAEFAAIEATNNRLAVRYLRRLLREIQPYIPSASVGAEIEAAIKATEPRKIAGHTKRGGMR